MKTTIGNPERLRIATRLALLLLVLALTIVGCGGEGSSDGEGEAADTSSTAAAGSDDTTADTPATAGDTQPAELQEVTFGGIPNLFHFLTWVAEEGGFFEEEGIRAQIVEFGSGADARAALLAGALDLMTSDPGTTANVHLQEPVWNLMGVLGGARYDLVVADRLQGTVQPNDLESLAGLRIGVTSRASGSFAFLAALFAENGLDVDQHLGAVVGVGGFPECVSAMVADEVDGCVLGEPITSIASEVDKVGFVAFRMSDMPELFPFGTDVLTISLVGTADWVDSNLETAKAVVRALVKAQESIAEDPSLAIEVGSSLAEDVDPAVIESVIQRWSGAYRPEIDEAVWNEMMDLFAEHEIIEGAVYFDEIVYADEFEEIWNEYNPGS